MINLDKLDEIDVFYYVIEENFYYFNKDYVFDNCEWFKFGML